MSERTRAWIFFAGLRSALDRRLDRQIRCWPCTWFSNLDAGLERASKKRADGRSTIIHRLQTIIQRQNSFAEQTIAGELIAAVDVLKALLSGRGEGTGRNAARDIPAAAFRAKTGLTSASLDLIDRTERFPAIAKAAKKLDVATAIIDGEAVVL